MIREGNVADSSGASIPPNVMLPVHELRKERERRKKKCILATCAIQTRTDGGDNFVGTGSLVKEFFENCDQKIHLITSEKVLSSHDLSCYFLWFKKLDGRSNKKWRGLLSICKREVRISHGLAFVPVDRTKFNPFQKRDSGILTHRPFTICAEGKEGLRNSKLHCHVVEVPEDKFAIKQYQVLGIADEEAYLVDHNSMKLESTSIYSHNRKGLGAPFSITGEDGIAKAVGAVTLGNNQQISYVLFSQIDRKRLPSGW